MKFFWNATRGHRLLPWRSEYLRWRFETYTGKPAKDIVPGDFWALAWGERRQFLRFLSWIGEMRTYAQHGAQD